MTQQFTPRYIPRRNENLHSHKNVYTSAYNSIIHNNKNIETTQIPISG